jgi:anti-sigma B factor antagonist
MELTVEQVDGATVVRVAASRIDAAGAIGFKEAVRDRTAGQTGPVVLDLSRVTFLDSSGLGAVVAVKKLLGPDRPLELAALTPTVEKVFRLTRMDSVFTIRPTAPAGLRHAG